MVAAETSAELLTVTLTREYERGILLLTSPGAFKVIKSPVISLPAIYYKSFDYGILISPDSDCLTVSSTTVGRLDQYSYPAMEKNNAADPELGVDYEKVDILMHEANPLASKQASVQDVPKTRMRNFMDSFKPADGDADSPPEQAHHEPSQDNERPSAPPEKLARKLKSRHMKLMAIASCVGTGLFVGSGKALESGGPASLLIAYGLIGIMMYCTIHALSEMGVLFPVAGSFAAFSTRFLDPAWGFAMGWNYTISWLVTLPLEITAVSMTIGFWPGARETNSAAWVAIFWVVVVSINLFSVRGMLFSILLSRRMMSLHSFGSGFGEAEFIFSTIKVITVIGFMLVYSSQSQK